MKTHRIKSIVVVMALAGTSSAQQAPTQDKPPDQVATATGSQKAAPDKGKQAKKPAVDPEAIAALEEMGAFLRDQTTFSVTTTTETDHILDSGQKVRLSSTGELAVRRPDRLRAEVVADRKQRQYFYDGKAFTINSPTIGYYATMDAPPTINELIDVLETKHGLALPLADLFYWGTEHAAIAQITSAIHVGESKVAGVATEHYAFRQPGLDWQIWIERGKPLPRKLVLTTTDDPARPDHTIAMSWDLAKKHDESSFAFTPANDSQKIALADVAATRAATAAKSPRRSSKPTKPSTPSK